MPEYLKAREVEVFRIVSEWKSMGRQAGGFPGLAERLAAHVEQIHARAFRAGQERMRERAGAVAAAYDRPDRDGRETYEQWAARDIAAAVRALPLEEAE